MFAKLKCIGVCNWIEKDGIRLLMYRIGWLTVRRRLGWVRAEMYGSEYEYEYEYVGTDGRMVDKYLFYFYF